jgi:PIN domain nuclease of toxin-antitoxin system
MTSAGWVNVTPATIVLDAWAVMVLVKDEAGADRIEDILAESRPVMSIVNAGEVYYTTVKELSERDARLITERLHREVELESPDWPLVRAAARLKARGGMSYADCFAVATAQLHRAPLVTADREILDRASDIEILNPRSS